MLPNCAGGCSSRPTKDEEPVRVRFIQDFETFAKDEEHVLLGQDPVEEVAILTGERRRVPFGVLERLDGLPFDTMDDLLGVARAQLALRT